MAWAFLIVGLIVIIAAIRGTHNDLWKLLKDDFSGSENFITWVLAIFLLAGLGTFKTIRPVTDAFLALVVIVIIIAPYRNGKDLFGDFVTQVRNGTQ